MPAVGLFVAFSFVVLSVVSTASLDVDASPTTSRIDAFMLCGGVMNNNTIVAAATDAHPVTLIAAERLNPANNIPPSVGPTMNASVHDASRHAIN